MLFCFHSILFEGNRFQSCKETLVISTSTIDRLIRQAISYSSNWRLSPISKNHHDKCGNKCNFPNKSGLIFIANHADLDFACLLQNINLKILAYRTEFILR
jgi:hypothetical protein